MAKHRVQISTKVTVPKVSAQIGKTKKFGSSTMTLAMTIIFIAKYSQKFESGGGGNERVKVAIEGVFANAPAKKGISRQYQHDSLA